MNLLSTFSDQQGFLLHFLELVKAKETDFPDVASFLTYYDALEGDELYVRVGAADAVQVMTIHKSKGLEFRAVVLPLLTFSTIRTPDRTAPSYMLKTDDEELRLYHVTSDHADYSSTAEELAVEDKMKMFFGELNSVYVALTRAACEMWIFIPTRAGNAANPLLNLIPQDLYDHGTPAAAYPKKSVDDQGEDRVLPPPACRDWLTFLDDEFGGVQELSDRVEKAEGVLWHALLEKICVLPGGDLHEKVREALLDAEASGLLKGRNTTDWAKKVEDFVSAALLQPFFVTEAKVFVEKEFVNRFGHSRRMDRVLVLDAEVWVLDFKLDALTVEGEVQVRSYMDILRDVYPGKKVRGFLISIRALAVKEVE
jgi:ATP-dependent exoDNAse (exonuclease V) beta subunit